MSNSNSIVNQILNVTGQFVSVTFTSKVKTASAYKHLEVTKITQAVVRAGINFANLSTVKEGIESGERGEVGKLPWGEWKQFPYIISHKGSDYVRLYTSVKNVPQVNYFVNGAKVSKETVLEMLTPSERKRVLYRTNQPECFIVKADNVLNIG